MGGIQYANRTMARAVRAWRCSGFSVTLLQQMRQQSISLGAIAGATGVQNHYTPRPLLALVAESQLQWLIQVGLLRREVDGQGITNRFRLTPLGQQLLDRDASSQMLSRPATLGERLRNFRYRWLRLF